MADETVARSLLREQLAAAGAEFRNLRRGEVAWALGDSGSEYVAARRGLALADFTADDFILVSGGDATSFLQGLATQDIGGIPSGQWRESLLLTPKGRVASFFEVHRVEDGWLLRTAPGYGPALAEALGRYRIRVEVDIRALEEVGALRVIGAQGAIAIAGTLGVPVPEEAGSETAIEGRGLTASMRRLAGIDSVDLIGTSGDLADAWNALLAAGLTPIGSMTLETLRVEGGDPALGAELDEGVLTQEAGIEKRCVNFEKGCYLGQEVVARIASRGHVNRLLRGVVVAGTVLPPSGAEVLVDGRAAGRLTTVAESLDLRAPVALAFVRREVEAPADATLSWDGGGADAMVAELPLLA